MTAFSCSWSLTLTPPRFHPTITPLLGSPTTPHSSVRGLWRPLPRTRRTTDRVLRSWVNEDPPKFYLFPGKSQVFSSRNQFGITRAPLSNPCGLCPLVLGPRAYSPQVHRPRLLTACSVPPRSHSWAPLDPRPGPPKPRAPRRWILQPRPRGSRPAARR